MNRVCPGQGPHHSMSNQQFMHAVPPPPSSTHMNQAPNFPVYHHQSQPQQPFSFVPPSPQMNQAPNFPAYHQQSQPQRPLPFLPPLPLTPVLHSHQPPTPPPTIRHYVTHFVRRPAPHHCYANCSLNAPQPQNQPEPPRQIVINISGLSSNMPQITVIIPTSST